jgi:anti-anti-sigma factor
LKILKKPGKRGTLLIVKGRMDAYWTDHFSKEVDEVIRGGAHHIILDLSGVEFMSSAGVGVLLRYFKLLQKMNGSLTVSKTSAPVQKILKLSGFTDYFLKRPGKEPESARETERVKSVRVEGTEFRVFPENRDSGLLCRLIGDPGRIQGFRFQKEESHPVSFPASAFGIGLGGLGESYKECRERFGEFLAVSGAAAYLPTDGTNVPDYMKASGNFVPELQLLYGIVCEGPFSSQIHFEVSMRTGSIGLSGLVKQCLDLINAQSAGMVILAETEGLVGAALRRSPALKASPGAPFRHPGIRKWLTFTSERAYARNLAVIAGIADQARTGAIRPFVRSMDNESGLTGHFHSLVFPYSPLKKGRLDLNARIHQLFDTMSVQDLLHLIHDERRITGAGQSEFIRGTCWIGKIRDFEFVE